MAQEGQEIHSPGGMTLRIERIAPDLLEMEAAYSGEAGMPPEHLHPNQAETFEIVEGEHQHGSRGVEGGEPLSNRSPSNTAPPRFRMTEPQ